MDQEKHDAGIAHATVVDVDSYEARKLSGRCTVRGCPRQAGDSQLCDEHRAGRLKSQRRYAARRRAEARRKGKCQRCWKAKRYQDATMCLPCLAAVGGVNKRANPDQSLVARNVDSHRRRVAERMLAWENSPTNKGRMRMRGGGRGRRSNAEENTADLRDLYRYAGKAIEDYARFESAEARALPPIQREENRQAAIGWVLLLVRTGIELCKRNGYTAPEQADHPAFNSPKSRKDRGGSDDE